MTFNNINFVENSIEQGGLRTKGVFKQSSEANPLISIITVVLNGENNLEESINSLHKQNYKNIEHIVIDGGSSDKTISIIKKYENKIDYWCQKKDKGIYDAFNTGMKLAKGDYLGFLKIGTAEQASPYITLLANGFNFTVILW